MAGKYSLLTILTLNAAGYDKGINQATKKTQAFKKGTQDASKSIASSFSSMGNVLGGAVNSQVGLLSQSIGGGVSAFRSMIPAITGVKTALIASGIGAIVVAIGAAFGALVSYLTGTVEGADKLNTFLGYIKGAFTALIKRVNYFGSAISNLFSGDFKKFKSDLDEAFKGGLFEEVKDSAKQYVQFADETTRLKKEKLALDSEEAELAAKMAEYQTEARNKNISVAERQKKQMEFKKLDAQLDERKQKYLYDEWQLQEKINKSKGKSIGYADLEAATAKKVAYYQELQKDAQEQATVNKIDYQLKSTEEKANATNGYIDTINDEIQALEKEREALFSQGKSIDLITGKIMFLKKQISDFNSAVENKESALSINLEIDDIVQEQFEKDMQYMLDEVANNTSLKIEPVLQTIPTDYTEKLNEQLESTEFVAGMAGNAISMLGDAIITMTEGGEASFKDMITAMLAGVRNVIYGLLAEAIAGMIAKETSSKGIWGLATAAIGITGIMALWAKVPKFTNGGIMGGNSFSGDNLTARVNSGEMILNQAQQANLFALANGGGINSGEVRFEIEGAKLWGVLENYNKKRKIYR